MLVLVIALGLPLSGCAGDSGLRTVVTSTVSDAYPKAEAGGDLSAVVAPSGTVCFLLDAGTDYALGLILPPGYTARDEPLRLIAPDGSVAATVGDRLYLGGGTAWRIGDETSEVRELWGDCPEVELWITNPAGLQ